MIRKILSVCVCLTLLAASVPVLAAEENAVTADEITEVVRQLVALALTEEPLNDPSAEDAKYEDGTAFMYDFGTLFTDAAGIAEDVPVNAALVMDEEIALPRGTAVSQQVSELLNALPCDNPELRGTRDGAVLCLDGSVADGFRYGRVQRDGQRIRAIEYGEYVPGARFSRLITLTYIIADDGVDHARIAGLREETDQEAMEDLFDTLTALRGEDAYSRVRFSFNGAELEPFCEDDLSFDGLNYLTVTPDDLGDMTERALIDNEDGTYLQVVDGDGFHAVFSCDAEGENNTLLSYTFMNEESEGPRGVRLNDSFSSDFNRFRNGEHAFSEETMTELLYGGDGTAPYGKAWYADGDGMTLRYVTTVRDGRSVEMYLHYVDTVLTEFYLHTL